MSQVPVLMLTKALVGSTTVKTIKAMTTVQTNSFCIEISTFLRGNTHHSQERRIGEAGLERGRGRGFQQARKG